MHSKRFKVAITLALALLIVAVLSAFAAPDANPEHVSIRLKNATIPWFFSPPDGLNNSFCPGIPPGYHVNPDDNGSNRRKWAIKRELPNGNKRILMYDVVTGTATDNFGGTYTFSYRNRITALYDGSVVQVKMKDYFKLKGQDFQHSLGFLFLWAYETDTFEIVEVQDGNGDTVNLDIGGFIWVTNDGVTESPDIVPGSWQVRSEFGNALFCDPL